MVKEIMDELRQKINRELEECLENIKVPKQGQSLINDIKEFTLRGGKRIRAILVVYGYKAYGGKDEKEILKAACAVELMQSFLLIHDDIIDCDELRRGKPTLHKIYEKRNAHVDNNEKLGRDIAIIAGDIASVLGQKIIQDTSFPDKIKLNAVRVFNEAIINTCIGQSMDIYSNYKDVSEAEITAIHRLKTAQYTLEAPLVLGAVFSGASEKEIEKLKSFATPMGEAFQLQDDIIGLYGDEKRTGKPIGSDLREGKRTLLITKALEKAYEEDKKFLKKALGNNELSQQEILRARRIVEETGSLEYSKEKAGELLKKAEDKLDELEIEDEAKLFFRGVAEYMKRREY